MRRLSSSLLAATILASALLTSSAFAVVIREDMWEYFGGTEDDPTAGFGPYLELAAEPQFAAVLTFAAYADEDDSFGCSGTWLGNGEDGHAYILTAGHCVDRANRWTVYTDSGAALEAVDSFIQPNWNEDRYSADDVAILELEGPITDSGEPPVLYSGSDEWGYFATLVGYGARGTSLQGEDRKFKDDGFKAAAQNMIDEPFEGQLSIDLDEPTDDESDEDAIPVDLEGTAGAGDSGGSLWIETDDGWRIAGIVSSGPAFAQVSYNLDFILKIFPDALTGE